MSENHKIKIIIALTVIVLSFFAMLAWHDMPIFPDEIAVRWLAGRYIQDGGITQKLFHYCSGNVRETPFLFIIPALIFSWIDLFFSPVAIRILPFLITLSTVVLTICIVLRSGKSYAAIIATTGFVGVAGSGLIMARSEYIQLLNIACCLGAFYFIESGSKFRSLRYGLVLILIISILMSLYNHIQGLLFLPLTLFMMFELLSKEEVTRPIYLVMAAFMVFSSYTTINLHKFSCPEHPEIVQYANDKVINLEKIESIGFDKYAWLQIKRYYLSFLYKSNYQINYLPAVYTTSPINQIILKILNSCIVFILLVNLIIFIYVACVCFISLLRWIWLCAKENPSPSDVSSHSLKLLLRILISVTPVIFLFAYDSDKNFYRSFYINLLISLFLAVVVSKRFEYRIPSALKVYLCICGLAVITSTVINFWWFNNKFAAGFEGPSMAIKQDWYRVNHDITILAKECSMDLVKGRIVVDDMTYDSLKSYQYLYPITYLQLSAILTGKDPNSVIAKIKPNYILARCDSFRSANIYIQKSRNGICCENLNFIEH